MTYFLNGGVEQPFKLEERVLIPSSKVATYDLEPDDAGGGDRASAPRRRSLSGHFDVVVINFANPDMVGHTGALDATVTAVEV